MLINPLLLSGKMASSRKMEMAALQQFENAISGMECIC
jgi:hypothetical protein